MKMDTFQDYQIDEILPLEYDSPPAGESMADPSKKQRVDWKWWITTGIGLLVLIVGGAWKIKDELAKIDKHISRVETAVRIIGAKQGGDTKTLIDEALAVAKNAADAGRTESAKNVLGIANHLLAEQKASREPVPQEFFNRAIETYKKLQKSPALADSAWEGATALAEYRSATTSIPPGFSGVFIGEMGQKGPFRYLRDSLISGENAISAPGCEGFALDGWYLDNVVFENLTICYRGSVAVLSNVHFVNCRFDVQKSPRADQLLEAVVKQPVNINLG